jgi:aminopeptidase N
MLPKVENALKLIGYKQKTGDIGTDVILRAILLDWACAFESSDCLNYATALYESWKDAEDGMNTTPTDIQTVIYCGAISNPLSGVEAFGFYYEKYKSETQSMLKGKLLNALACSKDERILEILLFDAITPESEIVDSDRPILIQKIAAQPVGRAVALNFINENLGIKLLTAEVYANVIASMSPLVSTQDEIDKIKQYIDSKEGSLTPVRSQLEAAISTMEQNVVWMSTQGNRMIRWFDENSL